MQRLKAADLLLVARRFPSFPLVLETYREVLRDVLDLAGLKEVLTGIWRGDIAVVPVETAVPSPFAASLLLGFIGAYMYEGETPRAERRGALLGVNRDLLREVIGSEQLRSLLDRRAIDEVHRRLQRLAADWRPRNRDETEDALRQLGDLSAAELAARGVPPEWLTDLANEGRTVKLLIGGEERWVAAADRQLYADPDAHRPAIIRRFARSRGPFQIADITRRYGFTPDDVASDLETLQAEQVIAAGEFTPGVSGREYCDPEALRQIHRLTLSILRREVEPAPGDAFARYLLAWQQPSALARRAARSPATPPPVLREIIGQLQGLALPAECWERDIFHARVPGYQPLWLDHLCATGEVRWRMVSGGKIAFALAEDADLLAAHPSAEAPALSGDAAQVTAALGRLGADFLGAVARAAGLPPTQTLDALLELMSAGLVSNDTFAPARLSQLRGRGAAARRGALLRGGTGRWSLLAPASPADPAAWARLLLRRYGVISREVAAADGCPVGWGELLEVLKRMELRGEVRRGWFVRELTGAQFALPQAIERLRAARETHDGAPRLVAAWDPANAYGTILPLPGDRRPARAPSTYLVLAAGTPVLLVESFGRRLTPLAELSEDSLRAALNCLKDLLGPPGGPGLRRLEVEEYAGRLAVSSPVATILEELGFQRAPLKYVLFR